ncbi:DUF1236 domain-containing protein [Propylenella binzhouense]|uniref:DUF1236 domain-containing protein n=1 Tax=Propylenella binzhouense TaxID=2555902 RepID=A0A964T9G8_9HYPH|nr:DUF1236 domain-containing protein [Propylenella binzhouense]MYZ50342.1 DUF1236 domain-containing protein [Propylenella binzhouense]
MRKLLLAAAATAILASPSAFAQEGTAAGIAGGAATGAVLGGPVGAVIGGAAGAMMGTAIDPPPAEVKQYVVQQPAQPVEVQGTVEVGAALPQTVVVHPVPNYQYSYAVVNNKRVLVDPGTRKVVYVIQ